MQNAYFGIPDTAGSGRAGRVTVRASIYKLHKSSLARPPSAREFPFAKFHLAVSFGREPDDGVGGARRMHSQEYNQHALSVEGALHPLRGRGGKKKKRKWN